MASISKQEMIERYIKAYNSFDIDLMLSCLHPDVRFKNISNGEINAQTVGKSEFESLARQSATLFKTRTQTVKSFEMAGDKVTVEIDFYAMLAKALSNDIKAGDKLALQGRSEFIFKDDLIGSIIDES